jgi:hypothetical protein
LLALNAVAMRAQGIDLYIDTPPDNSSPHRQITK